MPIPPGVLASDLSRLESAVTACKAERLLILGDLLHAPIGLTEGMIDQVATWQRSLGVPWEIVPGNHDRKLELVQDAWSLKVHRSVLLENGVGFTHDPADAQGSPQLAACAFVWSGHVHPVVRIRGFGDSLRLPAYIVAGRLGILPAFSRFTRGGPVHLDGGDAKAFAIAEGAVIDVQRMFSAP